MRALLLLFFVSAQYTFASEYQFRSKLDVFSVEVDETGATFNGESVSTEPFTFINPLFETEFLDACANLPKSSDLSITKVTGSGQVLRRIYFDLGLVSDGKNCGSVTGHGLYKLPLHRNWFTGVKKATIGLGQSFSIWKDNLQVVGFERVDGLWRSVDPKLALNWDFFDQFELAMKDFSVDYRLHPKAGQKNNQFELRQGNRIFKFIKVGETTWAVQMPDSPWLSASGQFSVFEDMNQTTWLSPLGRPLQMITDKGVPPQDRIKAVRSLADNPSRDVNKALHTVLRQDDDVSLKKEIVGLLRRRPNNENFIVLVEGLAHAGDLDLQNQMTKALRVRHPKGPVIEVDDEEAQVVTKINEWQKWRNTLK